MMHTHLNPTARRKKCCAFLSYQTPVGKGASHGPVFSRLVGKRDPGSLDPGSGPRAKWVFGLLNIRFLT